MEPDANEFRPIALRALEMVADGDAIGLGTGHAATAFIVALGERVRSGSLRTCRGVPTSLASAELARQLGIPLTTLDECPRLALDVDGADEVDPGCELIKGYGGALFREKIVAAASRQVVILIGPEKLVPILGSHGKLPVEVLPFGLSLCRQRITNLGFACELRLHDGQPQITDNGNYILDCKIPPLESPAKFDSALRALPGVVATGLFLGLADLVLIQHGAQVEIRRRNPAAADNEAAIELR